MKILVFLFPITLFLVFLGMKVASPEKYILLVQEDSVIENAQALCYFLSSLIAILVSIRFLKNKLALHSVLYGILAVGLLFVSLDEISWGQRIFNTPNPDYFAQHNVQNEISFHNLDTVQPLLHKIYILIGGYGAFGWLVARMFLSKAKTECRHIVNFAVPDWFISPYFFFVSFIYILFHYIEPSAVGIGLEDSNIGFVFLWRDQEPMELLLSLGFLSFVVANYIKLRVCLTTRVNSEVVNQRSNAALSRPS